MRSQKKAKKRRKSKKKAKTFKNRSGNRSNTVSSEMLEKLKVRQLTHLLTIKKIPGRSKLTTKALKIQSLVGLITTEDLAANFTENKLTELHIETTGSDPFSDSARTNSHDSDSDICTNIVSETDPTEESGLYQPPIHDMGRRKTGPVAGLDIHKIDIVWAIIKEDGSFRRGHVRNNNSGHTQLINLLNYENVKHIAMESTAQYHLEVYWTLQDSGLLALVANPKQTKAVQGIKTDERDALRIAMAHRDGRLKPSIICNRIEFELRKLTRSMSKKIQLSTRAANRISQFVYSEPKWIRKFHKTQRGRTIILGAFGALSEDEIWNILVESYKTGKGAIPIDMNLSIDIYEKNEELLIQKFRELTAFINRLRDANSAQRFLFNLEDFMVSNRQSNVMLKYALEIIKSDPKMVEMLKILMSVPGINVKAGIILVAEIINIKYFDKPKGLVKWSGMAPSVTQSGHRKGKTGKVYKGGNKYIRTILFNVARVEYLHSKHSGHPIGSFINRLITEKGKKYTPAVFAGARKCLVFIYYMLKNNSDFEEVYNFRREIHEKIEWSRKKRIMNNLLKEASLKDMLEARIRIKLEEELIIHDNLEAQINSIIQELSLISGG